MADRRVCGASPQVGQVIHAEEALASNITCMVCMEVLRRPTVCVPCGHNYCSTCLEEQGSKCSECGGTQVTQTVANSPLEAICSK